MGLCVQCLLSHCVILHRRPQALPGNASFASLSLGDGCSTLPELSRSSQLPNRQLQMQFICFYFSDSRNCGRKVGLDESRSFLEDSCEFIRSRDLGKADQEKKHGQFWKCCYSCCSFDCIEECTEVLPVLKMPRNL